MFFVDLFRPRWIRRVIERTDEFKEAEEFGKSCKPKESVDYTWVERHAIEEFHFFEARIDAIEAKADSLIKYLGAGSGIVALLSASAPALQVIPALLLLLIALFIATRALQPAEHPSLPTTMTAFEYAEHYGPKDATASFAAKIGAAATGMSVAAGCKGKCVRWAFWFFLAALTWLVGYATITGIHGSPKSLSSQVPSPFSRSTQ